MEYHFFPFKKMFWAYTCCALFFSLIVGLLSLFEILPIYFNNEAVYGMKAFVMVMLFAPFWGLMLSCFNWLALNFGMILWTKLFRYRKKKTRIQ